MDFYLLPDSVETLEYPGELNLSILEKMTFNEFKQIENLFLKKVNYFEDFRFTLLEVEILYKELKKSKMYKNSSNKVSSITKLERMCEKAIIESLGIIGFSD